jgi:stearoyl-CoA desaturase (delta-9 desaturase)
MPGYGVLAHPWWVPILFVLVVGHATNICTTLYLHRSMTHEGVKFRPAVEHLMRFWLWLTSAVITREWVAVHRKHHAYADREGDPHSPAVAGFWGIVLGGVFFYQKAARDPEVLEKYGHGCPNDWVEQHIYTRLSALGLALMLFLDVYLFGLLVGLLVWSAMIIWMPIMGNIINGIGHALGYRNFGTRDRSRNIYPWGIWILGEELHNNHHADPRSAKFQAHWWEFDIGWIYIKLLSFVKLAKVLYARSVNAKEFAAKHYRVAPTLEKAMPVIVAAAIGSSACSEGDQSDEGARDTMTQREGDSLVGELPIPGAQGVRGAMDAADSAEARQEKHDSIDG